MYLTKELINVVAENPKVCKHLHLPLQSGDDNILKSMHRPYSAQDYLENIHYIRKKMPDCGVTTDIIVGFPGEGEKEFKNTVDLIHQIKFSRLHIFSYSKRRNTPASNFKNQVDTKTKQRRNKILQELRKKYMHDFATRYLKREVEILVEQKGEGLTSNYIRCYFDDTNNPMGSIQHLTAKTITTEGEIRG
jgi:threonylcarbamoyladenosine tRNA methylthiotransferase MtaB